MIRSTRMTCLALMIALCICLSFPVTSDAGGIGRRSARRGGTVEVTINNPRITINLNGNSNSQRRNRGHGQYVRGGTSEAILDGRNTSGNMFNIAAGAAADGRNPLRQTVLRHTSRAILNVQHSSGDHYNGAFGAYQNNLGD